MKVTFLGVGSAFTKVNGQSTVLVEKGDTKLLLDCGCTAPAGLSEISVGLNDITHIFITHLHHDHIGGLEEMAIMNKIVFQNRNTIVSTPSITHRLWKHSLQGGLEFMELTPGDLTPQTMQSFFDLQHIEPNQWFAIGPKKELELYAHPTNHVLGMESYALWVRDPETQKQFFFSGDTRLDTPLIEKSAQECDILFHDCQLFDSGEKNKLGVHVSYSQLKELPQNIKQKTWIYHYGDTELPASKEDGFLGFVEKQQVFEF